MIDASDGFTKDGPKNRLREMDVHRVVDAYRQGDDIDGYVRFVPMTEIVDQDYNLNLPRYIDNSKAEDIQDIDAHLNGGIPQADIDALDTYWQEFSNLRKVLLSSERERYLSYSPYRTYTVLLLLFSYLLPTGTESYLPVHTLS